MDDFIYGLLSFVAIIFIIGLFILSCRLFGAWMLRIDEVIKELKDIKEILGNK